jgi:hypothetical protein
MFSLCAGISFGALFLVMAKSYVYRRPSFRLSHSYQRQIEVYGPLFPGSSFTLQEDSFQCCSIRLFQAKFREQPFSEMWLQSCYGDPSIVCPIETVERISSSQQAAGRCKTCFERRGKVLRALM